MNVCALISEYNPFHNGHKLHVDKTRNFLGKDSALISIMSGNFVQRGQPALFPKYLRAKYAVEGGVDLVVELPVNFCLSSAENFAFGAVTMANILGSVSHLSFGSESGDIEKLSRCAKILRLPEFDEKLMKILKTGVSYPKARMLAFSEFYDDRLLADSNNILAIEYLKALDRTNSSIKPFTIKRDTAMHDSSATKENIASASFIRELICNGDINASERFVPERTFFQMCSDNFIDYRLMERDMLCYLKRLKRQDFSRLADSSEGINNRLYNAVWQSSTFDEIILNAKTKRYTHSRIRRMLMCAYLNITQEITKLLPNHVRVLAFNNKGRAIIKNMKDTCKIPIIIKPCAYKPLNDNAQKILEIEILSTELYNLALGNKKEHKALNELCATAHYVNL